MNDDTPQQQNASEELPVRSTQVTVQVTAAARPPRESQAMQQRLVQLHTTMGIGSPDGPPVNAESRARHRTAGVDVLASLSRKPLHKRWMREWPAVVTLALLPPTIGMVWWNTSRDAAHDARWSEKTVVATAPVAATGMGAQPTADTTPRQATDKPTITSSTAARTPPAPLASIATPTVDPQTPHAAAGAVTATGPDIAGDNLAQLLARLESWRQAWANRDVDAYLAHYSPAFIGTNGQPRSAWAAARRRVISTRPEIVLSLSAVEAQAVAADRWELRFLQDYAAGGYVEKNRPKTLVLVLENGVWNIVTEQQTRAPVPPGTTGP